MGGRSPSSTSWALSLLRRGREEAREEQDEALEAAERDLQEATEGDLEGATEGDLRRPLRSGLGLALRTRRC